MSDVTAVDAITVTAPAAGSADPDEVTVRAAGQSVSGWTDVRITRGIEFCPNSYEVSYSEQGGLGAVNIIKPGDAATILIGRDTVITGYADHVVASFSAGSHELKIAGRGQCQDLVDCSAEWPTAAIFNADLQSVADKLVEPYANISVNLDPSVSLATPLPAFNVTLTETPFALIEEMARYYSCLVYEDARGNLVLSGVGKTVHASGFAEGINVQAATVTGSMADRFSDYWGWTTSVQVYSDQGADATHLATQTDPDVARHRRRSIQIESAWGGQDVGLRRLAWERTRRAGRGLQVNLTVDSWRDSAGVLWTPNQLATVQLPSLHIPQVTWIIGEVTYLRDDRDGTRAEVTLMPPDAYSPEPILLAPIFPDQTPIPSST